MLMVVVGGMLQAAIKWTKEKEETQDHERSAGFGIQMTRSRVPSLDGLRAISILLVFIAHATGTRGFVLIPVLVPLGTAGVQVFFIISGFLITTLLIGELKSHGSISLGAAKPVKGLR